MRLQIFQSLLQTLFLGKRRTAKTTYSSTLQVASLVHIGNQFLVRLKPHTDRKSVV